MAKKQSFADKAKKKDGAAGAGGDFLKVVKAYKTKDGAWKFRSLMVGVNDSNKSELLP
jgi:hypothetical protein